MSTVKFHTKQLRKLQEVFPKHIISPTCTMQEVQYQAGIAHVLRYIEQNTEGTHQQNINPITIGGIADG